MFIKKIETDDYLSYVIVCYPMEKTACDAMEGTSIHVTRGTKEKLKRFKIHPRETFEDVIKRLMEG